MSEWWPYRPYGDCGYITDSSVPTDPDSSSDSSSESTEGEDASSSDSTSEPEEGEESEDEDTEENPAEEFVALTVLDPETGATIVAEVGDYNSNSQLFELDIISMDIRN